MKLKPPASLSEKEWLNALLPSTTKVGLELSGYHSRLAPEPGWDTELRRIEEHLVYFVAEGRCSAVLDGKRVWLSTGSLCWICPTTPYRFFRSAQDPPLIIHRFRFTVERRSRALKPGWPFRFLPEAWRLLDTIKQIILEAERPGKFGDWRVRALLSLLSIQVFETSPSQRRGGSFLDEVQRAKIATLLSENTALRPTPSDLARLLEYSPGYFTRIFQRSYGMAPRAWLLQQRLRYAAMLLRESSNRVSDIAHQLGYAEVYLFSRQFRQKFGASPKQYRRTSIR